MGTFSQLFHAQINMHRRSSTYSRGVRGWTPSPSLPGISWRGTCAKLKPLATQASLTSVQFRALKSALAATHSTEKVQMMVSSLSIVCPWMCRPPLLCAFSAVFPSAGGRTPAVGPQALDDRTANGCNSSPHVRVYRCPEDRGVLSQRRGVKSPLKNERGRQRVWRCHMNPGGALSGASSQLG